MNNKYKYLLKNTGILTISTFGSKFLSFLLVPLYTNLLTTTEYGFFELIVSTVAMIIPIASLNIVDSVMRFSIDHNNDLRDVASVGIKYILISISIVVLILIGNRFFSFSKELKQYDRLILFYFAGNIFYNYFIQLAKGQEKVSDLAIAGIINTVLLLSLNILLLKVLELKLFGFFLAFCISYAVANFYLLIRTGFIHLIKISRNITIEKEMVKYSLPLIATTLSWWVNSASDKYMVSFFCGIASNGLLSISYKIPSIISTIQGVLSDVWHISAIKEYNTEAAKDFYTNVFIFLNFVFSCFCSILIICTKFFAKILFQGVFFEAWHYVPLLVVSTIFITAASFLGGVLGAKKDSLALMKSAIIGAFCNIILNLILIHFIEIQGAALATVISSLVIFITRVSYTRENVKYNELLYIYVSWGVLFIQAILYIYKSDNIIIQGIFFCFLLLLYSKKIVSTIKKLQRTRT